MRPDTMDKLEAVVNSLGLKEEDRIGWSLRDVTNPESVADHSWATALLCLIYGQDQEIDTQHAVTLAIIHDLAEVETGDIITRADAADADQPDREMKQKEERQAIQELANGLETARIEDLWQEYETRSSPEAVFVKDMDLVEMCCQALRYEREDRYDPDSSAGDTFDDLDGFFVSAEERVRTKIGSQLVAQLRERYESVKRN